MSETTTNTDPDAVYWFRFSDSDDPISVSSTILTKIEAHSEVFEGARHIREHTMDGRSEANPIFLLDLSGDFRNLVRYLELADSVTGTQLDAQLYTNQWLQILGIATKYEMQQIRDNAIDVLTGRPLSAIERIKHARKHRIASWLLQGIEELLKIHPSASFKNWQGLDYETAAKVLWVKWAIHNPQSIGRDELRVLPQPPEHTPVVLRYSELTCQICKKLLHPDGGKCKKCQTPFSTTGTFTSDDWFPFRGYNYQVRWLSIKCNNPTCGIGECMMPCSDCGKTLHPNQHTYTGTPREPSGVHDFIYLAFSEELKELGRA